MQNRSQILTLTLVMLLGLASTASRVDAQVLDADRIKAALRTATPEENGFVDRVVELVEEGRIPVAMVQSTFLKARNQVAHKFQYFRRGLILRATRAGVPREAFEGPSQPRPQPTARARVFDFFNDRWETLTNPFRRFMETVMGNR